MSKDPYGHERGTTQVGYRMVFDLQNPLNAHKKDSNGEKEIKHVEFFAEDERAFYFLFAAMSRLSPMGRAQAIKLDHTSFVEWRDANPNEEDEWEHLYPKD